MSDGPLQRAPTWSGRLLGNTYRLVQAIGEGGMGTVYEAKHIRLPRRFAVKVLRREMGANPDQLARFRREAELASRLRHRHIVAVLDYNVSDQGEPYLVMEHLEGETLASLLRKRHRLPLELALSITRQIGSALRAAHRERVIHRDLKPPNIFLCLEEGEQDHYVKVMDFGISKLLGAEPLTGENMIVGTPGYAAPEQVSGHPVTEQTDVFSLGLVLYEMLAGCPAFSGQNVLEILKKLVLEEPTPLSQLDASLPAWLDTLLDRALAKEPARRHQTVAEFLAELEAFAGGSRPTISLVVAPETLGASQSEGGLDTVEAYAQTTPGPGLALPDLSTPSSVTLPPSSELRVNPVSAEARREPLDHGRGRGRVGGRAALALGTLAVVGGVTYLLARPLHRGAGPVRQLAPDSQGSPPIEAGAARPADQRVVSADQGVPPRQPVQVRPTPRPKKTPRQVRPGRAPEKPAQRVAPPQPPPPRKQDEPLRAKPPESVNPDPPGKAAPKQGDALPKDWVIKPKIE